MATKTEAEFSGTAHPTSPRASARRLTGSPKDHLVPITIRIGIHTRSALEHLAVLSNVPLSEYLRSRMETIERLALMETQLAALENHLSNLDSTVESIQILVRELTSKADSSGSAGLEAAQMEMARHMEQLGSLTKSSFKQQFEAFFKLQEYLLHVLPTKGELK